MKLIIDIPTDLYNKLMKYKEFYATTTIFSAITNGTPISNEGDLISRSALKETFSGYTLFTANTVIEHIDDAPTVAGSCKELQEVATERPQTIGCFNCKHETKMVCEEPCMVCNSQYSEWRQKE